MRRAPGSLSSGICAPVAQDVLAVDVAGLAAAKKGEDRPELFGRAEPTRRDGFAPALHEVFRRHSSPARFVLDRCMPTKLKAPALNAKDGMVAVEELQLVYESLRLIKP